MQNKTVLKKYEKIDKKQKKLRRISAFLFKLPLQVGGYLYEVSFEKDTLKAVFFGVKNGKLFWSKLKKFQPKIEELAEGKTVVEFRL